jgi:RNA polymerase sigma-70 factor, ECF subfamily
VPADAVHRAVRGLPADLRIVLYLTDVERLSHRQAARVMGTSVSVVAARLHRAPELAGRVPGLRNPERHRVIADNAAG